MSLLCGASKGFMKALKVPQWGTTKKCENVELIFILMQLSEIHETPRVNVFQLRCWWFSPPAGIYVLKIDNWNTGTRCEVCWAYFTPLCGFPIVNFEHVILGWAMFFSQFSKTYEKNVCCRRKYLHLSRW